MKVTAKTKITMLGKGFGVIEVAIFGNDGHQQRKAGGAFKSKKLHNRKANRQEARKVQRGDF